MNPLNYLMKTSALVLLIFFPLMLAAQAQPPFYNWHRVAGSATADEIKDLAADASGNVISVGILNDTLDFEPGSGNFILHSPSFAMFIARHDAAGQIMWVKMLGTANNWVHPDCITLDDAGNIYIAGEFSGPSVDYDPGPGLAIVPGQGGGSGGQFILKLDPSGNYIWAKTIMGWNMLDIQVATDQSVYVAGEYLGGPNDFDPGPGQFLASGGGSLSGFLLKLNPQGGFSWVYTIYTPDNNSCTALKLAPSGAVYLLAYFNFIFDFAPGPQDSTLASMGNHADAVVLKLDTAGAFHWVRQFTSPGGERPIDMALDLNENVFACGLTGGIQPLDLDPGPAVFQVRESMNFDTWVVSLNSSGNFRWGGILSGTGENRAERATADDMGNFYLAGRFSDSADFNPDTIATHWLATPDHYDAFVTSIDSAGAFRWVKKTTGVNDDEFPTGLAVHADGSRLWMGGWYMETVDFDPGPGSHLSGFNGGHDLFLVHLGPDCVPTPTAMNASACDSFVSAGGHVWHSSGVYSDSLVNVEGCDSVVTVNLTIYEADTAVALAAGVLTSLDNTAGWQWIDCATLAPVPGATQHSFTPNAVGSYAVIVTEGFCTDTSSCVQVNLLNQAGFRPELNLVIFPNPGRGAFFIHGLPEGMPAQVLVHNSTGQNVWTQRFAAGEEHVVQLRLPAGLYALTVTLSNGQTMCRSIIIQ